MVAHPLELVLLGREPHERKTQQRTGFEIEGDLRRSREQRVRLTHRVLGGAHVVQRQLDGRRWMHDLHELALAHGEAGAHGLLAADDAFDAHPERVPVEWPPQRRGGGERVASALLGRRTQPPDALLGV